MQQLPPTQNAYDENQRQDRDIEVYEIPRRSRQGSYSSLVLVVTVVVTTVARSASIAAFASALRTSIRLFLPKSMVRPAVIIHLLRPIVHHFHADDDGKNPHQEDHEKDDGDRSVLLHDCRYCILALLLIRAVPKCQCSISYCTLQSDERTDEVL